MVPWLSSSAEGVNTVSARGGPNRRCPGHGPLVPPPWALMGSLGTRKRFVWLIKKKSVFSHMVIIKVFCLTLYKDANMEKIFNSR